MYFGILVIQSVKENKNVTMEALREQQQGIVFFN